MLANTSGPANWSLPVACVARVAPICGREGVEVRQCGRISYTTLGQASPDEAFFAFSFCNLLCDSLSCSDVVKDPSAFLLCDWMGSLVWPEAAKELQQVWWTSACSNP